MTQEGIPVAYEVFPGNTADVKTFAGVLETLEERFQIRRVILVGDRGMESDAVLKQTEAEGLEYIVGVKVRKGKAMQEVLSRAGRYKEVKSNVKVKEVELDGDRYVVYKCSGTSPSLLLFSLVNQRFVVSKCQSRVRMGGPRRAAADPPWAGSERSGAEVQ